MSNYVLQITIGVIAIIGGFIALFNPLAGTMAVEIVAAWFFLIVGVVGLFEAWRSETWGGKIFSFIIAIITVLLGIFLLKNPVAGVVSLTIAVGILILVMGFVRGFAGFKVNDTGLRWTMLISAAISIILGLLILFGGKDAEGGRTVIYGMTLGLMLGIELIMDGIALIALGMSRKRGGVSNT